MPIAQAQIEPRARYKGEMLPIWKLTTRGVFVKSAEDGVMAAAEVEIQPGAGFGDGQVEILNPRSETGPLKGSKDHVKGMHYQAELSSAREIPDCFALLVFLSEGSVGTHWIPVGTLRAGSPRPIEAEIPGRIDALGRLHVFSHGREIRTGETREAYDVAAYFADLRTRSRGLSALDLCKTDRGYPMRLSPDGSRLAIARDCDTHYSIMVIDLVGMKPLCDVSVGDYKDVVRDLCWISQEELCFICTDKLMMLDVARKSTTTLREDMQHIVNSIVGQPDTLVLYGYNRLGGWVDKFNVHTRKDSGFETPYAGHTYADLHGNSRLRISYESDKMSVYCRPNPDSTWHSIDGTVHQPGLSFDVPASQDLDRKADIIRLGPDGDTVYIASRLESDLFQIASYDLKEGVIKKVIAKHPRYDLTERDNQNFGLLFRAESADLIGLIFEEEKPRVVWLQEPYVGVQKSIEKAMPNCACIPMDWTKDAGTFIYGVFSDRSRPCYYLFKPAEGKLVQLLDLNGRLKDKELARMIPFDFTARDGATIHAYVTYPVGYKGGQVPLVVNVHGGPMSRDFWGMHPDDQFLASRGYAVLRVNYRGSSGFGAKYQKAGLYSRLDTVVIDDIADGARELIAKGTVDPKRVGIMGASFGGWATYISLAKYPELYRAGVAISAVSHWRSTQANDRWLFDKAFSYVFWKYLLKRAGFGESEKDIDPLLRVAEIRQPIYVMHGAHDHVVEVSEAETMIAALRKNHANLKSMIFPHSSHSDWAFDDQVSRLNEIGAFFEENLRPAGVAAAQGSP